MATITKTTAKSEITASAIYRITDKANGTECYAVPSDSQPGMFYRTCWNQGTNCWDCSCKAGQFAAGRGQSAHCKHTRAAQIVIVARANQVREQAEAKRIEREAYREFEASCGYLSIPGMY